MDKDYKEKLKKQGYLFIGEHSAVKTCMYTSKSLAGKGTCYKQRFYGIQSHRCVQMSVAVNFCNLDCKFCWRDRNNSAFGKIDDPVKLADNAIKAQRQLLSGFGGNPTTPTERWKESSEPLHFAISLNGENTAYPRLGEFIGELKKRGHSTYLVTNGQLPEVLRKMERDDQLPTQIYISMSAPTPELFKEIDQPLYKDGWERLLKSLDWINSARGKTRTTVRLTIIKDVTSQYVKEFAELVNLAMPAFLEVKSYSYLGASKKNYKLENMGEYDFVEAFAKELSKYTQYKIIDAQEESRVCLMMVEDTPDRIMKFQDTLPIYSEKSRFEKKFQNMEIVDSCDGCSSDISIPITHLMDEEAVSEIGKPEELLKVTI